MLSVTKDTTSNSLKHFRKRNEGKRKWHWQEGLCSRWCMCTCSTKETGIQGWSGRERHKLIAGCITEEMLPISTASISFFTLISMRCVENTHGETLQAAAEKDVGRPPRQRIGSDGIKSEGHTLRGRLRFQRRWHLDSQQRKCSGCNSSLDQQLQTGAQQGHHNM